MAQTQNSRTPPPWNFTRIPNVNKIILIASGKGGVGKSTTAVMLARAAAKAGKRVGLLDADISGASIPRMMGLKNAGKPALVDGVMMPITKDGIKCMSMGFIIGDDAAIMRGAMISKALNQMLRGVEWGTQAHPLDVLFIDLPPGTGDVHLSLIQQVPASYNGGGAIIVTTPQEVASEDAAKCGELFEKTYVPILGIIENMSHFKDPTSGEVSYIFGQGGGERLAKQFDTSLLAEIPLDIALREAMDKGEAVDVEGYDVLISALQ
jgi:ATP-binding protein involved in chromosome partitioning